MEKSNSKTEIKSIFKMEKDNDKFNKISSKIPNLSDTSFYLKKKNPLPNIQNLKIIVFFSYQKENYEFFLPAHLIQHEKSENNQFDAKEILNHIFPRLNFILENNRYIISYSTNKDETKENFEVLDLTNRHSNTNTINFRNLRTYYYLSEYPFENENKLILDIPNDFIIYLKFRQKLTKNYSLINNYFENSGIELNEEEKIDNNQNMENKKEEKTIEYVLKKLFFWKKLIEKTNMSSSDAANELNIRKKTFNEYYIQITKAYEYNFNFQKHSSDKISVLKKFITNYEKNQNDVYKIENTLNK